MHACSLAEWAILLDKATCTLGMKLTGRPNFYLHLPKIKITYLLASCNQTWVFSWSVKENPAFIQHLLYLQEERRRGLHGYQFCHKHK